MSDKYIIKNCPAILRVSEVCNSYEKAFDNHCLCQDCTDCLLKRIVKRCRKEQEYHKEWQKETGFNYAATGLRLANEILQLLDIQECEE